MQENLESDRVQFNLLLGGDADVLPLQYIVCGSTYTYSGKKPYSTGKLT